MALVLDRVVMIAPSAGRRQSRAGFSRRRRLKGEEEQLWLPSAVPVIINVREARWLGGDKYFVAFIASMMTLGSSTESVYNYYVHCLGFLLLQLWAQAATTYLSCSVLWRIKTVKSLVQNLPCP